MSRWPTFGTATPPRAHLGLADSIEPRLRCLVLLGGFADLRTGELLGLQRRDVDPLHGTVLVVRQAHELTGLGRVFTAPRSEAGRDQGSECISPSGQGHQRVFEIVQEIVNRLESHTESH